MSAADPAMSGATPMPIHGSVDANLRAAIQCARRLKDEPVHADTLDHWARLVALAKGDETTMASPETRELVDELERILGSRSPSAR